MKMVKWLTVVIAGIAASAPAADMLIAWAGSNETSFVASGISGSLTHPIFNVSGVSGGLATNVTSTDGTYGTLYSGAEPVEAGTYAVSKSPGIDSISFSITNNTGRDLVLAAISFDYGKPWVGGPTNIVLSYEAGNLAVTAGTVINTLSSTNYHNGTGSYDFPDYNWSLTSLADYTLANGEGATFRFTAAEASSTTAIGYIDNLAISGGKTADPVLLIGWNSDTSTNGSYHVTGISGNLYLAKAADTGAATAQSTDGTFGGLFAGASTSTNWAFSLGTNNTATGENDQATFRIVNNTGTNVSLDKLCFDISGNKAGAPTNFVVKYSYGNLTGVAAGAIITNFSNPALTGLVGDYSDYDVSLTDLPDHVLANGEAAAFTLEASDATSTFWVKVDNIAFSGIVGSEIPNRLSLFILGALPPLGAF